MWGSRDHSSPCPPHSQAHSSPPPSPCRYLRAPIHKCTISSPAKRCQIIFFEMFVNKVFQLVKPFFAFNYFQKTQICTPWPQKIFYFFFNKWLSKNAEFYADFKSVEIIWKVICQKLLQVNSIEKDKLQFCTLLLLVTFLLANVLLYPNYHRLNMKVDLLR